MESYFVNVREVGRDLEAPEPATAVLALEERRCRAREPRSSALVASLL
jgi:hypothetical protein